MGASLWRRTTTRRWRGGFRTDKGLPVVLERGATRTQRSPPPADRDCVRQSSRRKGMCPNVPRGAYVGGRTDACWSPLARPRGRENGELWRAAEDAVLNHVHGKLVSQFVGFPNMSTEACPVQISGGRSSFSMAVGTSVCLWARARNGSVGLRAVMNPSGSLDTWQRRG